MVVEFLTFSLSHTEVCKVQCPMSWVWHQSTITCWNESILILDEAAATILVKGVGVWEELAELNKCIALSLTSVVD